MMEVHEFIAAFSSPAAVCSASVLLFGGAALDRAGLWLAERRHARRARESTMARIRAQKARAGVPVLTDENPGAYQGEGCHESRIDPGQTGGPALASAPVQAALEPVFERSDAWAAPAASRVPDAGVPCGHTALASGRALMGAQQQLAEYLAFVRRDELGLDTMSGLYRCTRSGAGWVTAHRRWAAARGLVPMPELSLLRGLSEMAKSAPVTGVAKSRDRLKDPMTGAVLRNAHGTPVRGNYYTIFEAPAAAARATAQTPLPKPRKSSSQLLEEIEAWSRQKHGQPPARRAAA